jgi:hypothetical protein
MLPSFTRTPILPEGSPTGGRMTDAQYEQERTELRQTYGESRQQAGARWEQELAKLFARSEWTQEALAKKEGKDRSYIGKLLQFGRFLNFVATATNAGNVLNNLSASRFRKYWISTGDGSKDYNERQRFIEVKRLLTDEPDPIIRSKHRLSIVNPIGARRNATMPACRLATSRRCR